MMWHKFTAVLIGNLQYLDLRVNWQRRGFMPAEDMIIICNTKKLGIFSQTVGMLLEIGTLARLLTESFVPRVK